MMIVCLQCLAFVVWFLALCIQADNETDMA